MKKKFSLLLLAVFIILPVFALFGCDEVSSYKFFVRSSSYGQGTVSGEGTYDENSTVTLKATVTNQNSSFVAWLKPNGSIIKDDQAFQITNNENGGRVVGSTLTFTSTNDTRGTYTAVFSESAQTMQYITLDSFMVCNKVYDESGNFIANPSDSFNNNLNLSLEISQGTNSSDISPVFTQDDLDIDINQKINAITLNTLKLDAVNVCQIRIRASFNQGSGLMTTENFRSELLLGTSTKSDASDVVFQNGYYHMIFNIELNSENYFFVVTYHILTA